MASQPKREPFAPSANWGVDQGKRHPDPTATAIGTVIGRILAPVFFVICLPVLVVLAIALLIRRGPRVLARVIFNRPSQP